MQIDYKVKLVGGTLFNVLSTFRKNKNSRALNITDADLYAGLLRFFGNDISVDDMTEDELRKFGDKVSKYKLCKENSFRERFFRHWLVDDLQNKNFPTACVRMEAFVDEYIQDEKKNSIISSLKTMLEMDASIPGDTQFIVDNAGTLVTRSQVINRFDFQFIPFLSSCVLYAFDGENDGDETIQNWSTGSGRNKIEIPQWLLKYEDMVNRFPEDESPDDEENEHVDVLRTPAIPIDGFLREEFDKVFIEVPTTSFRRNFRENHVRFFHLSADGNAFALGDMISYLQDNMSRYFHGKAERLEYEMKGKLDKTSHIAFTEMKKLFARRGGEIPLEKGLGQMLVCAFLEVKGNAPKIMSRVELVEHGGIMKRSKTDGMHISEDGTIIFAASSIDGSLIKAVDNAFKRIGEINKNKRNEITILRDDFVEKIVGKLDYERVKQAVLADYGGANYKSKYGVFIGYNIGLDLGDDDAESYLDRVEFKILDDTNECYSHINTLLEKYGLANTDVSFYLLPFNDAVAESKEAFKEILEG